MSTASAKTTVFQDQKINTRIKLSALWASVMFCYVYGDYFSLYVPGHVQGFISGQNMLNSPVRLFAAALLMTVPAVMIFLSIVLKPGLNRWLNIIAGLFYSAIMLLIALTSFAPWWAFYVFFAAVEIIITSLIVYYAWKWPRQQS